MLGPSIGTPLPQLTLRQVLDGRAQSFETYPSLIVCVDDHRDAFFRELIGSISEYALDHYVNYSLVVGRSASILIERGHFDHEGWTVDDSGAIRHRLWHNDGLGNRWSGLCEDPSCVAFQLLNLMEDGAARSGIIVASPTITVRSKFLTDPKFLVKPSEYSHPVVRGFWSIKPTMPDWDTVWASVHKKHMQTEWND
jgi:hypothetical protein